MVIPWQIKNFIFHVISLEIQLSFSLYKNYLSMIWNSLEYAIDLIVKIQYYITLKINKTGLKTYSRLLFRYLFEWGIQYQIVIEARDFKTNNH